ncbi:MAG: type III pantothenate kinase [Saprospiraceae bacterium]|nr:type III pantothenate kinase [Saprospiraceae bacterium]
MVKAAAFGGGDPSNSAMNPKMRAQTSFADATIENISAFTQQFPDVAHCMLSSTRDLSEAFINYLQRHFTTIILDHTTLLPITIDYETPHTLGSDRIAAALGAAAEFPDNNVLAITAGTCITYNFLSIDGRLKGGGIAPGLIMRLEAMHEFTDQLPLVQNQDFDELIGKSTEQSMLSGARKGIIAEVDGIINQYKQLYNPLKVVISGGDTGFFESRLKSSIFADPYVVLKGLNKILEYNINN